MGPKGHSRILSFAGLVSLAGLAALLASCSAGRKDGQVEPEFGRADSCGDVRQSAHIYNGTNAPTAMPLTAGQIMAVGTFGRCTGTVITPRWVLTAEHCGIRVTDEFCVGPDPAAPSVCVALSSVEDHPTSDMTLVELAQDITGLAPVEPVAILTEDLDSSWLGRMAETAGYGQTESGDYGTRMFAAEPIVELDGQTVSVDGQGKSGACYGDSGGPLFVLSSAGVRVAGGLSSGDPGCIGRDHFARVDVVRPWIIARTGLPLLAGDPCGDVEYEGRCIDGRSVFCSSDTLHVTDCGGDKCGWKHKDGGYRCLRGLADPCDGVDGRGVCDGDIARWCDDGAARMRDCAACGQICGDAPGVGAWCVENPCSGLDYRGRCNGTVAEWCKNGERRTRNCADAGRECVWTGDTLGYFCE